VLTGAAVATVAAIVVVRSETSGAATTVITGNSVGVLQRSTGRPTGDVELTSSPGAVAYGAGALWVTYADSDAVARVDATRLVSTATAQVGDGPAGVAVGAGAVWVANGLDGTVSRVDPETNRQVQVIRVGNGPTGIAYGGGTVWVANSADGTVTAIDPTGSRAPRTIPALLGAAHVAFGFGRVWVVSPTQGSVVALDPTTGAVLDRVNVGTDPDAIATGAGAVWVANGADDTVWRIDPREPVHVAGAVPVGGTPVAIAAGSGAVWVGVRTATLQRISAARLRVDKTIDVGHVPAGIAVAGDDVLTAVRSTGAAHRGGTLRVVMPAPDTLDPARAYFPSSSTILSLTNDGLIGYRRVGGAEGVELVPDLAAAIPVPTDDGRTYTFRLRPGLRYSDGSLVRASDVRRSVERVFEASPTSAGIGYYGDIVGATGCRPKHRCDLSRGIAVDDAARTVTFHLKAPDGSFLNALALPFADVVPARVHAGRRLPATGPYMLARYVRGRSATLVRNPRFREWSADAQPDGYPNVITFRFRPFGSDSMPEARDVEAGRADVAPNLIQPPLTKPQLTALLVRHPSTVHLDAISSTRFFFLNTRVAPFDDVRVRRAVNDAFDREAFVRLLGPGNTPTCQILPPNFPSYRRTCPYRDGGAAAVAHARQVVRASGHEGARVTVWTFHVFAAQGRFMTSVLNAIGLRARLDVLPQDPNAYFEHVDDSRTRAQAGWFGWVTDFPSEGGFLSPLLRCAAFVPDDPTDTLDPAELCDRHLDRVLARASAVQASNPAAASPLWRAAERIALRAAPFVPTSNTENVALLRRGVGNYEYNPQLGVLLDELWVR
jgi:YVTN family beta-propeller protein